MEVKRGAMGGMGAMGDGMGAKEGMGASRLPSLTAQPDYQTAQQECPAGLPARLKAGLPSQSSQPTVPAVKLLYTVIVGTIVYLCWNYLIVCV